MSRPLGSIRPIKPHSSRLDMHYSGISGSAIALPPTVEKLSNDAKDQKRRESNSRTNKVVAQKSVESLKLADVNDGAKKTKPHEHSERCKEFEEIAAEQKRKFEAEIESLRLSISELQSDMKTKVDEIANLTTQASHYKDLYEKEKSGHERTKQEVSRIKSEMHEQKKQMEIQNQQQEGRIQDLINAVRQNEEKMNEIERSKDQEISVRDFKLERLKKQIAETLKGNSWERQQQLEELNKELVRVQEESNILKTRLKTLSKESNEIGGNNCTNCRKLNSTLSQMTSTVQAKDQLIRDLKVQLSPYDKNTPNSKSSK